MDYEVEVYMSKPFHEGYLMIDHRASPGTSEVPEGTLFETSTMHCAHCGTIVIMNPNRQRERANCTKCMKYVCDSCAIEMRMPDYVHKNYQQKNSELYDSLVLKETISRHG